MGIPFTTKDTFLSYLIAKITKKVQKKWEKSGKNGRLNLITELPLEEGAFIINVNMFFDNKLQKATLLIKKS